MSGIHRSMNSHRLWTPAVLTKLSTQLSKGISMAAALDRPVPKLVDDGRTSIYQPEQAGLIFPGLPTQTSATAHRQHLKERLVAACRAFALQGFDYGFAGHLTIRDPENPSLYWTNPMAVHFSQVKVSNL